MIRRMIRRMLIIRGVIFTIILMMAVAKRVVSHIHSNTSMWEKHKLRKRVHKMLKFAGQFVDSMVNFQHS